MIIAFVALGIITYIAALVCAIKTSDWKPRLFLSFYRVYNDFTCEMKYFITERERDGTWYHEWAKGETTNNYTETKTKF